MKCTAILNLNKADAVKRLISYGVTPKEAKKAVSDLKRNEWQNNTATVGNTTYCILYSHDKQKKYSILYKAGVMFA